VWAVLFWLNLLAGDRQIGEQLVSEHWARFGRNYYSRHDYEAVDAKAANELMASLRIKLATLAGRTWPLRGRLPTILNTPIPSMARSRSSRACASS
jgi:phosphoglucomutase